MEDIDLSDHKVTSEVHVFSEGEPIGDDQSIVHSNFKFTLPANYQRQDVAQGGNPFDDNVAVVDEDGDPIIHRRNHTDDYSLTIKHHVNTSLDLVGLQVWRGALLLADFLLHSSTEDEEAAFRITPQDCILELGAGTGLTSVVAGQVANQVISTDISKGNILTLIETNVKLNSHWIKGKVEVEELDFYNHNYSEKMTSLIEKANVIIAADVVYHDDLTDAFLSTLKQIMSMGQEKIAFVSLEKRYVFTLSDLDVVAPCYDYFYENLYKVMQATHKIEQLDTSKVPQYFCYERAKELVLFRIEKK